VSAKTRHIRGPLSRCARLLVPAAFALITFRDASAFTVRGGAAFNGVAVVVRDASTLSVIVDGDSVGVLKLPRLVLSGGDTLPPFVFETHRIERPHGEEPANLVFEAASSVDGRIRATMRGLLSHTQNSPNVVFLSGHIRVADGAVPVRLLQTEFSWTDDKRSQTTFWSFQGGSYPERYDWIVPLHAGFARDNYQGMNAPDYGGGVPFVDVWTKSRGVGLGYLSRTPEPVALPVRMTGHHDVTLALEDRAFDERRNTDGSYGLLPAVLIAHKGDCTTALETYAELLRGELGERRPDPPPSAYLPEWCGWGYGRSFRPEQLLATLPLARDIGFGWATVDDGWQIADGDWEPDPAKFPLGLKPLTDSIHAAGLLARLWWVPLEAHDSAYSAGKFRNRMKEFGMALQSKLALAHPEWFQLNADGSRTQVSWWNSYTLCPAVPEVRAYYCALVKRMVKDWGFDGLKIDGQNMNAVPPCYNPAHRHRSPFDASRAVPLFFRELAGAVREIRPDAVIQLCPCGTMFSIYNLSSTTQTVASDPTSSFQVRTRGKILRALGGNRLTYSGDHVELTNRTWDDGAGRFVIRGEEDFASTIGIGGVPSSKFTLPGIPQEDSSLALTQTKERIWRSWISAYEQDRLQHASYPNLYDIGFDKPETHVLMVGDTARYALYCDTTFTGTLELRGLKHGRYDIQSYPDGRTLGRVEGPSAMLPVNFKGFMIIRAVPTGK